MSKISRHIQSVNEAGRKALAVFLTAGFPDAESFLKLAFASLDAGADLLEIGIPFSDPIADGPIIQKSSQIALQNGTNLVSVLRSAEKIKQRVNKPVILMGYANPVLHYGLVEFIQDAKNAGVDGLIIPDVPVEEYTDFWNNHDHEIDKILLTTPTSSAERIRQIDALSSGFVYCVSVTGITGMQKNIDTKNLKRTYNLISKNKMLIGFGISEPAIIKKFSPFCDGVIVGSAVIQKILSEKDGTFSGTGDFIRALSIACHFQED